MKGRNDISFGLGRYTRLIRGGSQDVQYSFLVVARSMSQTSDNVHLTATFAWECASSGWSKDRCKVGLGVERGEVGGSPAGIGLLSMVIMALMLIVCSTVLSFIVDESALTGRGADRRPVGSESIGRTRWNALVMCESV